MLTFRTATMGHVHAVFSELSLISTVEVNAEGGWWWMVLPKIKKLLALPNSQTEALVDETGKPLAIFGHYASKDPYVRTTWFVFSNGFMDRGAAVALACRRRVKALQVAYPSTFFHSYTLSQHPTRDRWFSLLGFQYAGTPLSGKRRYVLHPLVSDLGVVGQYNPTSPQAS